MAASCKNSTIRILTKMKNKFSTAWKASKRPGKQRKYAAKAPLHLRKKFMSVNLSKELRKKYGKRNIPLVKGDKVKIMRGKFKKKEGKVTEINRKNLKVYIEGIQIKKQDGSKANVPIKSSKLQIIDLNMEDKKRMKTQTPVKSEKKTEIKTKETKNAS